MEGGKGPTSPGGPVTPIPPVAPVSPGGPGGPSNSTMQHRLQGIDVLLTRGQHNFLYRKRNTLEMFCAVDVLRLIIGSLPIEDMVYVSRTCRLLHLETVNLPSYKHYKDVPPQQRESILQTASLQQQKQYLLRYFFPRHLPDYTAICMFAAEHCSLDECRTLCAYNLSCVNGHLEFALASFRREKDLLELFDVVGENGLGGFWFGGHHDLWRNWHGSDSDLEDEEQEWEQSLRLGIFPDLSTITTCYKMVVCLQGAIVQRDHKVLKELLSGCESNDDWTNYAVVPCAECALKENDDCLKVMLAFYESHPEQRPALDKRIWFVCAEHYEDPCIAEKKALAATHSTHYDAAVSAAASAGYADSMLYFLQKIQNTNGHVSFQMTSRRTFEILLALHKYYGSCFQANDYFDAFMAYHHDHEWLVDWFVDCVGEERALTMLSLKARTLFERRFAYFSHRIYTLGRLVERGLLDFEQVCKVFAARPRLAERLQLFRAHVKSRFIRCE